MSQVPPTHESSSNPENGDGSEVLARIVATHVPALTDDLFNVIRAIVPPPPVNACGNSALPEKLFSRRPSEKSLLERISNQLESKEETKNNLEEFLIQIIEPKKYTNEEYVKHVILKALWKWPNDEPVQEQSILCLHSLTTQNAEISLPQDAVVSALRVMEKFPNNETMQRICIKLFKNKKFLSMVSRVQVTCLILNSLCHKYGMDDTMLSAACFVNEMNLSERSLIRCRKPYVEMLLGFPNRQNDKITVCLCWSALDILIMFAECGNKWDAFHESQGIDKVHRLSQRPEFEDRCKILLEKILPPFSANFTVSEVHPIRQIPQSDQQSVKSLTPPLELINLSTCSINRTAVGNPVVPQAVHKNPANQVCTNVQNGLRNGLKTNCAPSNILMMENIIEILPVDEVITRKPPTPPPTVEEAEDNEVGWFSDDESTPFHDAANSSPKTPPFTQSPSYSPPPEIGLVDERLSLKELLSCSENRNASFRSYGNKEVSSTESGNDRLHPRLPLNGKTSNIVHCFVCNEPKRKQHLLMKQLNQISHCLLQPCNSLLLKCLKSNLCKYHSL